MLLLTLNLQSVGWCTQPQPSALEERAVLSTGKNNAVAVPPPLYFRFNLILTNSNLIFISPQTLGILVFPMYNL